MPMPHRTTTQTSAAKFFAPAAGGLYGHFDHAAPALPRFVLAGGVLRLDGCLIGFVVFVCCTIQHITTYKIAVIPRCSAAGGLCRGGGCNAAVTPHGCACARLCPAAGDCLACIARVLPGDLSRYGAAGARDFASYKKFSAGNRVGTSSY